MTGHGGNRRADGMARDAAGLSKADRAVLAVIGDTLTRGRMPSIKELRAGTGMGRGSVCRCLAMLTELGYLRRTPPGLINYQLVQQGEPK